MSADTNAAPPSATVVIAQKVRPGRDKEYLSWQAEMNKRVRHLPRLRGRRGRPARLKAIQNDYVVVFRFDTFPHLDGWLKSDAHVALLARGQDFFAGTRGSTSVAAPHAAAAGGRHGRVHPCEARP